MSRDSDWPALDSLRGIAAILMVANHAAVRWCQPIEANEASRIAFAVGGLAPALFFFASGFGYGVQTAAASGSKHRYGFLRKVIVLVVADQFTRLVSPSAAPIADFLTFIAASMLVLEGLRRARHGPSLAAALFVSVALVRFVLPPLLQQRGLLCDELAIFAGTVAVPWNAYPPFPWLTFPLAGFVLGATATRERARLRTGVVLVGCALAGVAGLTASALLGAAGHPASRYGTLSAGYLPLAFGGLAIAMGAAQACVSQPFARALGAWLQLRGLASLLLVPVHYWVLACVRDVISPHSTGAFLAALLPATLLVFAGTRLLAKEASRLAALESAWAWGAASLAAAAVAGALLLFAEIPEGLLRTSLALGGAVAVCLMLVLRARKRAPSAPPD